jgi:catechol 1,2-dioxygenase
MAPNGVTNGARTHKFDPNFTQNVINATGPKATPRTKQLLSSLIQHIHDFARENELTIDEWMQAVDFVRPINYQTETTY